MIVNTNLAAGASSDSLEVSQARLAKSLARISSGSRIVQPGDDAAGLAVGTRLDAELHRVQGAKANVTNAMSFIQTQEGYMKKIAKALDRMSELSLMAMDAVKTDADRSLYDKEFAQLKDFITGAGTKEFNGLSLFSANALAVTVDAEGGTFQMTGIDLSVAPYITVTGAGANIGTATDAATALTDIKTAITALSTDRATVGAYQARLNIHGEQLMVNKENLQAASSRIQDVDIANESTEYARANIMVQANTAMLAQANQLPQQVLRLLQ